MKSNAIVITKDNQTLGVGAGQTSRVGSAEIACKNALKFFQKKSLDHLRPQTPFSHLPMVLKVLSEQVLNL